MAFSEPSYLIYVVWKTVPGYCYLCSQISHAWLVSLATRYSAAWWFFCSNQHAVCFQHLWKILHFWPVVHTRLYTSLLSFYHRNQFIVREEELWGREIKDTRETDIRKDLNMTNLNMEPHTRNTARFCEIFVGVIKIIRRYIYFFYAFVSL